MRVSKAKLGYGRNCNKGRCKMGFCSYILEVQYKYNASKNVDNIVFTLKRFINLKF
jgi:hypothetical protein